MNKETVYPLIGFYFLDKSGKPIVWGEEALVTFCYAHLFQFFPRIGEKIHLNDDKLETFFVTNEEYHNGSLTLDNFENRMGVSKDKLVFTIVDIVHELQDGDIWTNVYLKV